MTGLIQTIVTGGLMVLGLCLIVTIFVVSLLILLAT